MQRKELFMPRTPGHLTTEGKRWYANLARAQQAVADAERRRDEIAREALAHGLGVRGAAKALGINMATVSRRYRRGG
jgi:DNA-binding transcriptional LysR family regulator